MIKTYAAACLLGTALVATPAFAQQATPAESGQFVTQMTSDQWRGSKLVGVDVYGSDNAKIGDINEVIVDRNGSVKAVVIGVGGFLGIGEKNVAIAYDKIQWNAGGNQSSGMASSAPAGGMGANPSNNTTSNNVASTATGSANDTAMTGASRQTTSTGGASLSPAPSGDAASTAPTGNSTAMTTTNTTGSTSSGGTSTAASATNTDYPERAMVQMSKQDLQNAPEFHYASQAANASNSSKGGAGGSSLTGTNQNTTGMSNQTNR